MDEEAAANLITNHIALACPDERCEDGRPSTIRLLAVCEVTGDGLMKDRLWIGRMKADEQRLESLSRPIPVEQVEPRHGL